MTLLTFII